MAIEKRYGGGHQASAGNTLERAEIKPTLNGGESTAKQTKPIHRITRWSGEEKDETPLCGAAPDVWGNRTVFPETATCETCQSIASR